MRAIARNLLASAAVLLTAQLAGAGSLSGTVSPITSPVNLTAEGTADWAHWGLNAPTDFNHKATGGSQISNVTLVGTGTTKARFNDSASVYSWSGGTPTASANLSPTGIYINNFTGPGRGFQFTVPADATQRTLEVFLGEFNASGTLEATLSDGSAATYTNTLVGNASQTAVQGMYTLNYSANSPSQTLTVKWTETADFGDDNVTLQAAALKVSVVPEPATMGLVVGGVVLVMGLSRRNRSNPR
jgi:hypothetical protein